MLTDPARFPIETQASLELKPLIGTRHRTVAEWPVMMRERTSPEPVHRGAQLSHVRVFPTRHLCAVNAVVGIVFLCNLTFFVIVRCFHQMNKIDPVENRKCSSCFLPVSGLLIYSWHRYFKHYEMTICYINWNPVCLASYRLQRVFWPTPCSSWEKQE